MRLSVAGDGETSGGWMREAPGVGRAGNRRPRWSDYLQRKPRIEAAEILWIAGHHGLAISAGTDDDACVDHVVRAASAEQDTHDLRDAGIKGNNMGSRVLQQSRQPRLTRAAAKRLRQYPRRDVNRRVGHRKRPGEQCVDALLSTLERDQRAGIKREASQSSAWLRTLSAQA